MLALVKLKVIVLVGLAVGLLTGGAGLLASRGPSAAGAAEQIAEGPSLQSAQDRPAARPLAEQGKDAKPARQNPNELQTALDAAHKLEAQLEEKEDRWKDELLEAHKEVLKQEGQVRGLERQQQAEREREDAELKEPEAVTASRRDVRFLESKLNKVAQYMKSDAPELKGYSDSLQKAKDHLKKLEAEANPWERLHTKTEEHRFDAMIQARLAVLSAQEKVRLVERRQARARARVEADLDEVNERVRHARVEPRDGSAGERRPALERKVDRLLREVEELRREMRRQPGRDESPTPQQRRESK